LADQSNDELVRNAYNAPALFTPGDQFAYSNLDYYVLAQIVDAAAGKPWTKVLNERIFVPLDMAATRTTNVIDVVPNRAGGYICRDDTLSNARPLITLRAGGALLSSVSDLVKSGCCHKH
jgi:D-alanyl-D-alanine carboxypeptidase